MAIDNDPQTRFKQQKRTYWTGVERFPILSSRWDGSSETYNKNYFYFQRQQERASGSALAEESKEEEKVEIEQETDDNIENPNAPPKPPAVLLRLLKHHPNLLITRGVKGSKVYSQNYESSEWWKKLCVDVDKIIGKRQSQKLSLCKIQKQKQSTMMLMSLAIINGFLIYVFSDFIFGSGSGGNANEEAILGVVDDLGVGIIFIVLIVVLLYGVLQYSRAVKNEGIIVEKLNQVLTVNSTKSSTCFVNTTTSDSKSSGGSIIVEDVLTKDISVSFYYMSQSYDDWLKESLQKLGYGFLKLFYDIEPTIPPKVEETSAYCDFTPPVSIPNTNTHVTGNYIEIKVNVVVSSYSTPNRDPPSSKPKTAPTAAAAAAATTKKKR